MAQRVHESIEVQAPLEDVFGYWSHFENFPNFMQNVEEVWMTGQDTSHWSVKGPLGKSVEFDAKTTEMDPSRGEHPLQPRAEPQGRPRELRQDRRAGRARRPGRPEPQPLAAQTSRSVGAIIGYHKAVGENPAAFIRAKRGSP
jgi:Polyketide cyclase / dehydrase and lipid transport